MNTNINDKLVDRKFKDNSPMATVERIRGILKENGLEVEEVWHESSVPYCYSLSIKLLGTIFRVNGKGLTKEFALASGYGEFMERFQMGFIYGPNVLKDGDFAVENSKYEMRPIAELLKNRSWYEKMAANLHHYTRVSITPEQIVGQYADKNGNVSVTPYFDLTRGTREFLPTILRKRVYATNGCAAGNTPEEAIVQAISEIVERSHQTQIIEAGYTLPDVPDEILQQYEAAYAIISYVREQGYKVCIKDASLGTGFPVVCACIIDMQTGRYHTHFGAYPIFEIALTRSLTESFQGRNIHNIATFEDFSHRKSGDFSLVDLSNELTMGAWNKRPEFFIGQPHRPFDPNVGFSGKNNRELLKQCIEYFRKQNLDILVRDRSCLGFPTYQVAIPGYSEVHVNRLSYKMDDHRYAPHAIRTLRSPAKVPYPDLLGLMMHLDQMNKFGSNIRGVHGFLMSAKLSANIGNSKEQFLMAASMAYAYYALGQKKQAIPCVSTMLSNAEEKDVPHLILLKRYLSLIASGRSDREASDVVSFFHQGADAQALLQQIRSGQNPFAPYVLDCDMNCREDCSLFHGCYQNRVNQLSELLDKKMEERSFDDFASSMLAII